MIARRDAGFTLLELLVAITLLAFLSVGVVAGLRFGNEVWRKAQGRNIAANDMRVAERILAGNLARVYPKFIASATGGGTIDFDGARSSVTFLSTLPASGHISRNTLRAVADGSGLAMQFDTVPELAHERAGATTQVLLRRLSAVEFSYYGTAEDSKAPAWHSTWQDQGALPDLIRIRAASAGSGVVPWPEMIIAPKIAADAGCIYDPLTKFCQGRR